MFFFGKFFGFGLVAIGFWVYLVSMQDTWDKMGLDSKLKLIIETVYFIKKAVIAALAILNPAKGALFGTAL